MEAVQRKKKDLALCYAMQRAYEKKGQRLNTDIIVFQRCLAENSDPLFEHELAIEIQTAKEQYAFALRCIIEHTKMKKNLIRQIEDKEPSQECAVCYCSGVACGPDKSPFNLGCKHSFCIPCWIELIAVSDTKCPMCRRDVQTWMQWFFTYDRGSKLYEKPTTTVIYEDDEVIVIEDDD